MYSTALVELLRTHEQALLDAWIGAQRAAGMRVDLLDETTILANSAELLRRITVAAAQGGSDLRESHWQPVRSLLERFSFDQSRAGLTPSQTATFVFSLKEPLFRLIQNECDDPLAEIWAATQLIDALGLYSVESYVSGRETVIREQQESMLELSTPVVELWDGILAIPLIGSLDSNRTQVVMESLLEKIVQTESDIAIIDITGVPTVDTMVAQHLLKTVTAARLMGAQCIISGIRPQIAATIVHLGVELGDVITKASLADAFRLALKQQGVRLAAPATR
ncbi:STAS domain-containing protein [Pseudomonas oryzihabitans]|uniref:RsbT co-antagonist protein RsbR n=1 Tax=Pseudomonas oryzihabitans TaxID=47885 RepID=A0AAJ2EZF7_9PSED|nr:STAS domain-containing protein [Pseudomonas psychrotolerans]MDR6234360.1 rsbT co-antagonist protein RsbR [Pseudomonas psychrotolerans]MDR6356519.1 rsbT co-antagonist protein RsbR [Pseudomonas psychrotolerans]QDD90451.1 anti-anti-sigma factor [Pseudomonas psychrotolerans]